MFKNFTSFRVEWGETDIAGIIFYPNYFRWFDRATHELFRAAGMPIKELKDREGIVHPIVESGCRFMAPLYYDDPVTLETTVSEVCNRTFRLEHTARRGETVVATGFEVRAWVKQTDGQPMGAVAIPDQYAARLRAEANPTFDTDIQD